MKIKDGNGCQRADIFFCRTKQQHKKRNEKMKHRDESGEPFPVAGDAMQIPADFVRLVAGINDQKLREGDVSPKHHKREQQIAEIVKYFSVTISRNGECD